MFKRIYQKLKKLKLRTVQILESILNILLKCFMFFSFIFLLASGITNNLTIIEPIDVPAALKDMGFSEKVFTARLMDHIEQIRTHAITNMKHDELLPSDEQKLDMDIPGTGISIDEVLPYLRSALGVRTTNISGKAVFNNNQLHLYLSINHNPIAELKAEVESISGVEELLQRAAEEVLKQTQPYILANYYFYFKQNPAAALERIHYILYNNPPDDNIWAYNLWGNILWEKERDAAKAAEKYQEAVELAPRFFLSYYNKGVILLEKGQYPEAIQEFKQALKRNRNFADAYLNWGAALVNQEKYKEAIDKFKRVLAIDHKHTAAAANLGYTYHLKKEYNKALSWYREALKYNPGYYPAQLHWAETLLRLKQYDNAIARIQKAVALAPASADAYMLWGTLMEESGNRQAAVELWKKVIELDTGHLGLMAKRYIAAGRNTHLEEN